MPRDEWQHARDSRFKNRPWLGYKSAKRKRPKIKKSSRPLKIGPVRPKCACGGDGYKTDPRVFKDGTRHIQLSCAACGAFLKWEKQ